ncbi:hypothetical protein AGABI2DRAFT_120951 [Agaricus bisporus var. bisporus H97]|uniref:hypothetical protein n=1 Tax=Agaricus bisporus var. bisporus (strain H97 / ATCC MYA-4626 / FGSC 10389) TaxID=936046 RepID=UPI00029F772E|nr:hypothetical protein AGABI2DRAFT_120951 [Agaricus bisporus var. bisporus H97]EKV44854.1 hypothetical protein AGABI2DRAFT_120951 [Agaricus bisporus var. bisporus H97]
MASCHPSYSSLSSPPSSIPKRSHFPSFGGRRPSGGSRSANGTGSTNLPVPTSTAHSTSGVAVAASPNTSDHHYTNGTDNPTTNYTNASNSTTQLSGTSAGSGIPSLRSLRSLLPFGNAFKQHQPPPQPAHEHSTPSKGPFSGFGSMRKSMNLSRDKDKETRRERKMSLASDLPFIAIERKPLESADDVDGPLRRSISLPGMETPSRYNLEKPLPAISSGNFFENNDGEDELTTDRLLRTPSPGPPLLAELSTIIEADSSGISKHIPFSSPLTDSSSSLPTSPHRVPEEDTIRRSGLLHPPATPLMTSSRPSTPANADISLSLSPADNIATAEEVDADLDLELSTSQLASQVQDAMARTSWSGSDGLVMIDAENSFVRQDHQDLRDDGRHEIDFSVLAHAGSTSPSPSPSPTTHSFSAVPPGDDDTSRINNSLASVVNPNELCSSSANRGEYNTTLDLGSLDPDLREAVTRRAYDSPISPVDSSASGHTVTPSSPPRLRASAITQQRPSASGSKSASAGFVPSTPTKYSPLGSSIPQPKRRVASSFIPRVQSPPLSTVIHSASLSTKNLSSLQRGSFERVRNAETSVNPKAPVFVAAPVDRSANDSAGNVRGGLAASMPAKVKPKETVAQRRNFSISSVPVASRRSPRHSFERMESEGAAGPEVRIVEASGQLDPSEPREWRDGAGRLGAERHSAGSLVIKTEPDEEGETRILGSPFQTSFERGRLGHDFSHSPSYSPCPSPTLLPSSTLRRTTTPTLSDRVSTSDGSLSTPTGFIPRSSSSPYPQPQSLIPTPFLSKSGFSGIGRSREGSPSKLADAGDLGGRASTRTQAPAKSIWSNSEGNGSSGEEIREFGVLPDRQPSPLRSVFGAEKHWDLEARNGRPSIDDTMTARSVRPSLDSGRPSLDSHPGSSSASGRSPEPRYYASTEPLTARPPTRLRDREWLFGRVRKRSVGPQEYSGEDDPPRDLLSPGLNIGNLSSAAISARERLARARYGELGGSSRPWSSMSLRSGRPENLLGGGDRKRIGGSSSTIYMRERDRSPGGIERSASERTGERERDRTIYRDRSGSASALGGGSGGGIGTLGRYASLRSASEYNFGAVGNSAVDLASRQSTTRAHSRMAFSESGGGSGHGRRDSATYSTVGPGLMESPISTVSTNVSGSARDTGRSGSTGATSVSQLSLGNTREREELRELKEKHAVETGALLGALSDSQRTCRVLREENGELRDKMTELEKENERLKVMVGESEQEIERLKILQGHERERIWLRERELGDRRNRLSMSIGNGTIASWRGAITPIAKRDITLGSRALIRQQELTCSITGGESQLAKRQSRSKLDNVLFPRETELDFSPEPAFSPEMDFDQAPNRIQEGDRILAHAQEDASDGVPVLSPTISSTPSQSTVHKRRPSTSSSIFPVPPPNMTMLLDDESAMFPFSGSKRNSADISSLHSFKLPPSGANGSSVLPINLSRREGLHTTSNSLSTSFMSSNMSISPTENLSMITSGTGSPGSLLLKPEHEMMLDEMESLDLNRYREEAGESEIWN